MRKIGRRKNALIASTPIKGFPAAGQGKPYTEFRPAHSSDAAPNNPASAPMLIITAAVRWPQADVRGSSKPGTPLAAARTMAVIIML
jgi:hypothetical protein